MSYQNVQPPAGGKITTYNGMIQCPDNPVIPFIRGDGTGPDIWAASERVFDAPRERVFAAFTDPELIPRWWGPRRMTTTVDEMDVRVGGKWSLRTASDLAWLLTHEATVTRKLSRAAIETLAIVAYHQPVTRAEIEEIRGVVVTSVNNVPIRVEDLVTGGPLRVTGGGWRVVGEEEAPFALFLFSPATRHPPPATPSGSVGVMRRSSLSRMRIRSSKSLGRLP